MEINDIALPVGISLKNRYQLRETYYIGPMSIVYMGYDMQTGKQVVIKEFCPYKLSNRDMDEKSIVCRSNTCKAQFRQYLKGFQQECEIVKKVSRLTRPYAKCTLQYVDDFEENATTYLVTEYVEGISLEECIHSGQVYSVRNCMLSLVRIVKQLHKLGIIHRDIKPANIMIRPDGNVVLIDFGSACYKGKESVPLQFVSRGYSAPELYDGRSSGYQTDIYSIGVLLYYLLTDYQLPAPDEMEGEEVPDISEFHPIPPKLEAAIMGAIERDPAKRMQSLKKLEHVLMA